MYVKASGFFRLRACNGVPSVFFEPTDRRKACKALHKLQQWQQLDISSPNMPELRAMANYIKPHYVVDTSTPFNEIIELSKIVSQYVRVLIVTLGSKGVVTVRREKDNGNECLYVRLYPATALPHVENVSGAGDCFSSGFIHGTLLGLAESHCVSIGIEAAKHALLCKQTVPVKFSFKSNWEGVGFDASKHVIN